MSTEVDHRISPALHPGVVKRIEGFEDDTIAAVLAPTVTAFDTAYQAVQSVWEARAVAERNPAYTDEARLMKIDDFASKKLASVTRMFDNTRANLEKGIAFLEGELSQPVKALAGSSEAGEIRAYVAKLSTTERQTFIQKAIADGDEETVSAVLGAKHYLSGLNADMQKVLLRHWHERQNPDKARRLKAMQAAKELIERDGGKVFKEIDKAIGGSSTKAKKVREANEAAEKLFASKDA